MVNPWGIKVGFMKMNNVINPPEKDFQIRCPRLGHKISFSYCSEENNGLPCHRTLDCWYPYFPVYEFFRQKLTEENWKKAFESEAQPKVSSIVELIERAKKVKAEKL